MNRQAMGGGIGTGMQQSRSAAALLPILPAQLYPDGSAAIGSAGRADLGMPEIIAPNATVCIFSANGGTAPDGAAVHAIRHLSWKLVEQHGRALTNGFRI